MPPIPTIRLATLTDIPAYCDHLRRHYSESGRDGDLVFMPTSEPWNRSIEEVRAEKKSKWGKSVSEAGWERCWLLVESAGVFGELKLVHAPAVSSALHRATLMIGIERDFRGKGLGSQLMRAALDWARAQPSLEWLQLFVFAHNEPARALYAKFGFQEVGRTPDMFRVHGQKIDDIEMVLRLR
jgi:RimJ/RimL family protein N-acetyltransferase